jgi:hypothetical protein
LSESCGRNRGYSIQLSPKTAAKKLNFSPSRLKSPIKSPKPRLLKEIESLAKDMTIKSNYINRPMIDTNRPHLEFNMRYYLPISSQRVTGLTKGRYKSKFN